MMETKVAPKGTLVGGKRQYTPLRLTTTGPTRMWKRHCRSERFIVLDPEYGVAEYNSGKFPRAPVNAHGRVEDIQPTILYHYTHLHSGHYQHRIDSWGQQDRRHVHVSHQGGPMEHQHDRLCSYGINSARLHCS